jgi:signal transduction histidine kinase/CheY-like chemotaxis protein
LTSPNGNNLGTLCVIDHQAGDLSDSQKSMLKMLARQVVAQMELRKTTARIAADAKLLQEANAALLAASMAKTDFIANVSHEIRNPLNAVIGSLQLLSDETLPQDATRFVQMGLSAAETLMQLINDVLDMSKIEAGKLEIHPEPVDLKTLSEDIVNLFRGQASTAKVNLDIKTSSQCSGHYVTDDLRIKQILINLIGNAIKFTPANGHVRLHFDLISTEEKTLAKWDIRDTGVGMSPQTLSIIGERFTQADASVPTKFGGSGLGLNLVKTLIGLLDGSLSFSSTPGSGTLVSVAIPVQPSAANNRSMGDDPLILIESCDVLIVDDTATNRIVLRKMLESLGFKCFEASGGKDAIRWLDEKDFPVIFLDLQMPDIDGFEVLRTIRAKANGRAAKQTPRVVAVTGNTLTDEVKKCYDAGFDAHVPKPITKLALTRVLSARTQKRKPERN